MQFNWCKSTGKVVGKHAVRVLSAEPAQLSIGVAEIAACVPSHYTAEEKVARILARLGKPAAAEFLETKLPTTKAIRSGDLGEILATEYIETQTKYKAPIKRLRWKDHRNMAMRGDDVIAIQQDVASGRLNFLKTEAKSRVLLGAAVLDEARTALDKDEGLPSAHALSFVSERLVEMHEEALADAIDDAQLKYGIQAQQVRHLLFTFSGNAPDHLLEKSLQAYTGTITQLSVGVHVADHAGFVRNIYNQVIANANNP